MGILRLAHVDVQTPDLDLAAAYYSEVMGLREVLRTPDTAYFKCWDEHDHHSLRMRYSPRTGLDSFTFRGESEDDLGEFEKKVEAYGCPTKRVSRGEAVGQGTDRILTTHVGSLGPPSPAAGHLAGAGERPSLRP
jgi:catechol 2,3-dioxygenase